MSASGDSESPSEKSSMIQMPGRWRRTGYVRAPRQELAVVTKCLLADCPLLLQTSFSTPLVSQARLTRGGVTHSGRSESGHYGYTSTVKNGLLQ